MPILLLLHSRLSYFFCFLLIASGDDIDIDGDDDGDVNVSLLFAVGDYGHDTPYQFDCWVRSMRRYGYMNNTKDIRVRECININLMLSAPLGSNDECRCSSRPAVIIDVRNNPML